MNFEKVRQAVEIIHDYIRVFEDYPITPKGKYIDVYLPQEQYENLNLYALDCVEVYWAMYGSEEEPIHHDMKAKWEDQRTMTMDCPFYGNVRITLENEEQAKERIAKQKKDVFQEFRQTEYYLKKLRNYIDTNHLEEDYCKFVLGEKEKMKNLF